MLYHSILDPHKGDGVVIGASTPEQLMQNVEALEQGPLPKELVDKVKAVWEVAKDDAAQYYTGTK